MKIGLVASPLSKSRMCVFGDDDDVCQRTAKVINQLAGEYFPSGLTTLVS